jgi:hypothetical protein
LGVVLSTDTFEKLNAGRLHKRNLNLRCLRASLV